VQPPLWLKRGQAGKTNRKILYLFFFYLTYSCFYNTLISGGQMDTRSITVKLPVNVFSILKKKPEEFMTELRLAAAVKWYEMGMISQEKASELAGISREDFLLSLIRFGVSPFQYTAREILEEAGYDSEMDS
jgi:predicted HTH domain antitoxin